ncbi:hypothetical protein [Paraburkholderia sp. J63]|uniref:hypothetical protein n=1 Tax=Paraburkholderia sp. J63 TaxID=2805434 RepID=UPI002ABD3CE2|nr:hypothetical protein [Paraburkholderia sp. J63]
MGEKVIELVNKPNVLKGVRKGGDYFLSALRSLNSRLGMFREVRSMGLLIGAELSEQFAGRVPELVSSAFVSDLRMRMNVPANSLYFGRMRLDSSNKCHGE